MLGALAILPLGIVLVPPNLDIAPPGEIPAGSSQGALTLRFESSRARLVRAITSGLPSHPCILDLRRCVLASHAGSRSVAASHAQATRPAGGGSGASCTKIAGERCVRRPAIVPESAEAPAAALPFAAAIVAVASIAPLTAVAQNPRTAPRLVWAMDCALLEADARVCADNRGHAAVAAYLEIKGARE
jgi:hypothetical protein